MASYKDNAPLQFSPYVQTTPVEAMAKVGMYRQERYEQGVQKIQQSIDNIAGLDIVRPEDKQYLQSKLNQLGSQLSMVAGGDFSNFSLVNSVNGMTNQIVKDPRVMKDVTSSAAYKKALENKEKIIQEGKGSASNDFIFNEQVNAWMTGGEDASFNATYRRYSDYEAKKREIIKTLTAEKIGTPVVYGPDGKLLNAMTYTEVEELSPQKILTALKQGLSPDEYQQLQIDGRYKYANVSKEQFVSDVNSRFMTGYDEMSKSKAKLERQMQMLESLEDKKSYEIEINKISNEMSNLKQQYGTASESFLSGDVESAKARLYTNDWFNDSANVYKYRNVKQEYKTNPILEDLRKVEKMNRADVRAQATLDQQWDMKMLDIQAKNDERLLEQQKITAEEFQKRQEERDRITVTESGTGDDEPLKPEELIKQVQTERDVLKNKGETIKSTILKMTSSEFDEDNSSDNKKFISVLEMYGKKSTKLKFGIKQKIAEYLQNQRLLNIKNESINSASDYADIAVDRTDYISKVLNNLNYEGDETITIHPEGYSLEGRSIDGDVYEPIGQGYDYTVEEIANKFTEFENSENFISKYNVDDVDNLDAISKYTKKPKFTPNQKKELLKLTNNLDPRMVGLYKAYWGKIGPNHGKTKEVYQSLKPILKEVDKVRDLKREEDERYNEAFTKKLKETYVVDKPINITIPTDGKGEVKALQDKLLVLANERRIDDVVIDIGDSVVDASAVTNANSAYMRRAMDGSYKLFYASKDGAFRSMDITRDEAIKNFPNQVSVPNQYDEFDNIFTPAMLINKNEVVTREIPQEDEYGNVLEPKIVKTQAPLTYYTTATDGKYNTERGNEMLDKYDFPNVKSFEVTGNIVGSVNPKNAGGKPVFSLQLNIKDPKTQGYILKNVEMFPLATKSTVINTMRQISDDQIIGYIETEKMKAQQIEEQRQRIREYIKNSEQ